MRHVDLPYPALDVLAPRHVALQRQAMDLAGDLLDLLQRPARHRDTRARSGELARDARADSAAAAGDERDLSFELML